MTANSAMYRMPIRGARSNSACDSRSRSGRCWRKFAVMSTVTVAVCLPNALLAAIPSTPAKGCPSQDEMGALLGKASGLMEQSRYQEAADSLRPFASLPCDARVSLLLAAASEMSGDVHGGEETLEQGHAMWPANNSIAATLARQYLSNGRVGQA